MKKILRIFMFAFVVMLMHSCVGGAEDLNKLTNEFYAGLAVIIEDNMDAPEICVKEVDRYYLENQALIAKIRKETEKAMAQAAPMMEKMMDKYSSMSEEELDALGKKYEGKHAAAPEHKMSPVMTRYSKAMETFTMKHPGYAMKIAMKAMELMPVSDTSQF